MRSTPLVLTVGSLVMLAGEHAALASPQCTDIDTFNNLAAQQNTTAKTITLDFDVTGVNPADYPEGKGWMAEFAYTGCINADYNDYGGVANLKVYGNWAGWDGSTGHAPGSIKNEYGMCCVSPPGGCPDNWADSDFKQPIFTDPNQKCHVKMSLDDLALSYSIQCDGGTVYSGSGDNKTIGLKANKASVLKSVSGGHPMSATTIASNVQVCFDLGPASTNVQKLLAVEDATVLASTPDTVVLPDTDLSCGDDDGTIYLKFSIPDPLGKVKSARVILTASSAPSSDGTGGDLYFVSDNSWSEKTITWNKAPKTTPPAIGQITGVALGGVYPVDVTSKITGKGTYSFALAPLAGGSPNGAHFLSKEASATTGPQLVVEYTITDGDSDTYPDGPDCNDANASIHPGATELCNSVDDNCDGVVDEGCGTGGAGGSPDASTDAAPDASGTAGKGAGGGTNLHPVNDGEPSDSGCSCRAAGKEAGTGVWVAAMLAGLIAAASARRSGRSRSQSR